MTFEGSNARKNGQECGSERKAAMMPASTRGRLPKQQNIGLRASASQIFNAFRSQHAAFLFACLFLVMEYNKLQHVYPILNVIPWGTVTLFVPLFLATTDKQAALPPRAIMLIVLAFSTVATVSVLDAFRPSVSLENWKRIASPMIMLIMLSCLLRTRARIYLFVVVYFLVNLKMAQHGFLSWARRGFSFQGWGVTGSPVWFQNSGEFAMQMAIFLPLVLALTYIYWSKWKVSVRVVFAGLAVMAMGSIIASGSRGGLLALAGIGMWFLTFSRRRVRAFLLLGLAVLSILWLMPDEFAARFDSMGEDRTSLSRLTYWEYALDVIRDNPLTGVGLSNWPVYVESAYPELIGLAGRGGVEVVHNTLLEAGTEYGWPGMLVLVWIVLWIFVANRRSAIIARRADEKFLQAIAASTNGSLIAFLIASSFMSVLLYPVLWMMVVFTACVRVVLISGQGAEVSARRFRRTPYEANSEWKG